MLVILMTAGAWTPGTAVTVAPKKAAYTQFFFYALPDYDYIGCETVAAAESEFMLWYGYLVDQSQAGGTLVGVGYLTPNPVGPPSVKLYAHLPLD
ncbi:MAG TPA: hypothetical protein VGM30_04520 [Puia sp.]